ncbi:MAG: phosphodiesterase [Candidatus Melainabacteria bacterium]|nr:phosphodiesterase [Candidatus Melainabacteria bacterium]
MLKHTIIQITDTHLFGDKNRKINGANSYSNLKKVLSHVALSEKPDLIVVTGDLSQDCTFESYQHMANVLNCTGIKYYLLPGNHDDVDVINKVFDFNWVKDKVDYSCDFNNWFISVVDTSVYPEVGGQLSDEQIKKLENNLVKNKNKSTLVFMHHHPIFVNSDWLDEMILKDADKFNKVIQANSQVKAVLFGHIHQVFEKTINSTFYGSTPACCYQVQPNTKTFTIEKLTPGYRVIELNNDGFCSKVVWVE